MSRTFGKLSRRALLRNAAVAGAGLYVSSLLAGCKTSSGQARKPFQAGAYAIDITPRTFPISVNGMMNDRVATTAHDTLHARCLVLDDGDTRLAIVVVDSLMITRELLDEAKQLASQRTGIRTDRILISATHTHAAPSVTHCFQSVPDIEYSKFLVQQIASGIEQANKNVVPARIGWAVTEDLSQVFCRMWIVRNPGWNPFGEKRDRAVMHPGYENINCIEPAGVPDAALTLISFQRLDGSPLALFANYSMHYAEDQPYLSADYFGEFCRQFSKLVRAEKSNPNFVAMLANGAMGDAHCFDYGKPKVPRTRASVGASLAKAAHAAWENIQYQDHVPLVMVERTMKLGVRKPAEDEITKAKKVLDKAGKRELKGWTEIYSRETVLLADYPAEVEIKLQALRVGGLGMVTVPVEAYSSTGLHVKEQSPFESTCVIGLANGYNGYMAPPEQHEIGGYSTWRARSCYLETGAAPKVTAVLLEMLRDVARSSRVAKRKESSVSPYAQAVREAQALAYWPMNELAGYKARNLMDASSSGTYEKKVVHYLTGPHEDSCKGFHETDRAAYFFDQRMVATIDGLKENYSLQLWFCSARAVDDRAVTGFLFSHSGQEVDSGDHLGISGTALKPGRLFLRNGSDKTSIAQGKTVLSLHKWYHLALVREKGVIRIHLNGATDPEITTVTKSYKSTGRIYVGGHANNKANFEGKICQVAIYKRVLMPEEIQAHYTIGLKGSAIPT